MTGRANPTPAMQAVIDALQKLGAKPLETLSPEEARKQPSPADAARSVALAQGQDGRPEPVGDVIDRSIPGPDVPVRLRLYWPRDAAVRSEGLPVVLYIHGGGWVIADLDVYDASPRAIANATGAIVVSTHYRQAPENRFPAAHEDTYAAYRWILDNARNFGGDPQRVALVGESAGGNMAANISIRARDEGVQAPLHQVLVYPVANNDMESPSYVENADAKPLGKAGMAWFVKHVFASPDQAADPRISLLKHPDLSGLPPTTILLAQIDPLRSEGEALAEALSAAGVAVCTEEYLGVAHEFFGMAAVLDEAKDAQTLAAERLREAFGEHANLPPGQSSARSTRSPAPPR